MYGSFSTLKFWLKPCITTEPTKYKKTDLLFWLITDAVYGNLSNKLDIGKFNDYNF